MAKKSTTKRVHQIAKELGVTSKDVVAKCKEEDVPNITNHMSAISLGLGATIREWFGEAEVVSTAVQTATPVDVKQARAKAKRRSPGHVATAVAEPPPAVVEEPRAPAPEPPPSASRGSGLVEPPSRNSSGPGRHRQADGRAKSACATRKSRAAWPQT